MRTNYWSLSKFAKWLRTINGITSPGALTAEGWDEWRDDFITKKPFIYWFTDKFLNKAQDAVMFIPDTYWSFVYWFGNRFIGKLHCLSSDLNPNTYHEINERVLHSLFRTLVDFVECEKAWMEYISHSKEYDLPWWSVSNFTRKFKRFRRPDLGLKYIEWEKTLTYDWVGEDSPLVNKPTAQAETAWELYRLYYWWKEVRPERIDPYGGDYELIKTTCGDDTYYETINRIEMEFDKEDEVMMHRMINILTGMWT